MRGREPPQTKLFSYVNLDSRIPAKHPIRKLRQVVDVILATLDKELSARYAEQRGRPSIPPERLLRALLLQAMYSIRSERQLPDGKGHRTKPERRSLFRPKKTSVK